MSKNHRTVNGQHGIGAKGQGKATYFQTRIAEALRQSKARLHPKNLRKSSFKNSNGHWAS